MNSLIESKNAVEALLVSDTGTLIPEKHWCSFMLQFRLSNKAGLDCINAFLSDFGPCTASLGELIQYPACWVHTMVVDYGLRIEHIVDGKFTLIR